MKVLLRWFAFVLVLIGARVLLALAILAGVLVIISEGLQAAGLRAPPQQQIAQRLDAARADLAPLLARIRAATAPPASESAPASGSQSAQASP